MWDERDYQDLDCQRPLPDVIDNSLISSFLQERLKKSLIENAQGDLENIEKTEIGKKWRQYAASLDGEPEVLFRMEFLVVRKGEKIVALPADSHEAKTLMNIVSNRIHSGEPCDIELSSLSGMELAPEQRAEQKSRVAGPACR